MTDSKTLLPPVSGLRSCAANKLMRDINKMTQGGLTGRVSPASHPETTSSKKAPIRGESVAYLGWDGKMGPQTWTDEDQ